jgi:hypothetical protein
MRKAWAAKLLRLRARLANLLRGPDRPHWCADHRRFYNPAVFRSCPDCLKESGPFYN